MEREDNVQKKEGHWKNDYFNINLNAVDIFLYSGK